MNEEARARRAEEVDAATAGVVDLLHLSDLHFGAHSRFQGEEARKLGERFCADLRLACASNHLPIGPKVDLVLVTGDLAETGHPKELAQAEAFLTGLAGGLGLPHDRFLFVPGNHDVSWPRCVQVEAALALGEFEEAELRGRLDGAKFEIFDQAILRFYGVADLTEVGGSPLGRGAWLYEREVRGLALSIAALNSCERESHRPADHLGEVSKEQVGTLLDRWLQPAAARQLKLVLVHHNPVLTMTEAQRSARQWLEHQELSQDVVDRFAADVAGFSGKQHLKHLCQDARVQLLLHGHHHAKDEQSWEWRQDGRTYVLSAGSLSLQSEKLPSEEPLSVRLIRLDAREHKLTAWPLTFIGWARTEGQLERGAFTLDPAAGLKGYRQELYLPEAFQAPQAVLAPAVKAADPAETASFVAAYRRAVAGAFSTWELSVASGMTSKRQASARLDAMYVPLRFGWKNSQGKAAGWTLEPEHVLGLRQPVLLSGVAGSGKTTWVRHTFRRLAEGERAVPLMVELRKLANDWDHERVGRSLVRYLDFWAASYLGSGWQGATERFLAGEGGPVPVLLVDGWDELGALGAEVRDKLLAFMEAHPRVLVVVTSRPFGEGRPSSNERFEAWTVAELNDEAVELLSEKFYQHCHPEDEHRAVQSAREFLERLMAAPDARALAGTPLLLAMLLMLGSREPLPEKRHQLYEICLRNLLWSRPKRREEEGARPGQRHFRPDDSEVCLRAVAALALGVQRAGYARQSRSALPFTAAEAVAHLPKAQFRSNDEVAGFLAWLAEAAGVLTDRSDDQFQFAHLSIQEFLSAWQLHATHGDDRAQVFREFCSDAHWWETLVLWAALVQQQNPAWLDDVVQKLAEPGETSFLAGAILADGLGSDDILTTWVEALPSLLESHWPRAAASCTERWKLSRQEKRRSLMEELLGQVAKRNSTRWLPWLRLDRFREATGGIVLLLHPPESTLAGALLAASSAAADFSEARVAASRVLCSGFPLWPLGRTGLGLLQVWPGPRRQIGLRLQAAAAIGADYASLVKLTRWLRARGLRTARSLARYLERHLVRDLASDWASDLARYLPRDRARYWENDLARDVASDTASDLARDLARYSARDWALFWARDWAGHSASDWARDLARDLARHWASDLARYLAREAGVAENEPWLLDFSCLELNSLGRAGARAVLARANVQDWPEAQVLQQGVLQSLGQGQSLDLAGQPGLDPLWPALARHVARCSTAADRKLLEDLTRHPELREPPLSWGLQFIVRGDVMLDGGRVLSLDELCAEAGVEPLPYLEEMPPELDWD